MDLDDLRIIVWNERESGKLSEVPAELFATGRAALKDIPARDPRDWRPILEEGAFAGPQPQHQRDTDTIVKLRSKRSSARKAQIEGVLTGTSEDDLPQAAISMRSA
jgi:DNA replication factor GINS